MMKLHICTLHKEVAGIAHEITLSNKNQGEVLV